MAAKNGHKDIVAYLLEHGADPEIVSNRGRAPLQEAVRCGHQEVAELLSKRGSVLPAKVAEEYLWRAAREGELALAQRSVQFGPPDVVNCIDDEGDHPLWAAVRCRHIAVARYLVASGADTSGMDLDGNTLSDMAKRRRFWELVDDEDADKLAFLEGALPKGADTAKAFL